MIRRPPRSTLDRSSAASDVYKRQSLTTDNIQSVRTNIYSWQCPDSRCDRDAVAWTCSIVCFNIIRCCCIEVRLIRRACRYNISTACRIVPCQWIWRGRWQCKLRRSAIWGISDLWIKWHWIDHSVDCNRIAFATRDTCYSVINCIGTYRWCSERETSPKQCAIWCVIPGTRIGKSCSENNRSTTATSAIC